MVKTTARDNHFLSHMLPEVDAGPDPPISPGTLSDPLMAFLLAATSKSHSFFQVVPDPHGHIFLGSAPPMYSRLYEFGVLPTGCYRTSSPIIST